MDLQWQLLVTHAVGFLITLWILKKFAWGPLLHMLDERRNKLSGEFENIEPKKEEVTKLTIAYENKLKGIDEERRVKIVEAVNDGKKMAVPDMGFKSKKFLYVRRDWMDNLGIDDPENYDELEQMLRKMRDNDPDGSGLKERYPLAAMSARSYFDTCFLSAFVATGDSWY